MAQPGEWDLLLFPGAHVAQYRGLAAPFLGPHDHDPRHLHAAGLLHLALETAPTDVDRGADSFLPQLGDGAERALARSRLGHGEQDLRPVGGVALLRYRTLCLHRLRDPLEAGRPARSGSRVAADLLDQAVVAPAAADA